MMRSPFGYVLKALRTADGLTVEQLAERAQLSPAAVRHIERGFREPSYQTAGKLADVLGVGLDAFREGPNQRPVESGHLRDARLAALGRWHREEATYRRLEQQALDELSPATRRELSPKPDPVHQYHCIVCHHTHPVEWAWCPDCLVCHSAGPCFPVASRAGPAEPSAVAAQIAGAEPAAGPAEDGAGDDQVDDVFEPRVVEDNPSSPQPAAAELVGADQLGQRTQSLLALTAELGKFDPADRKAYHRARRRAVAAGGDLLDAQIAGCMAVRRSRLIRTKGGKRPPRIAQDARSRPRSAPGTAAKRPAGKGRKGGRQE